MKLLEKRAIAIDLGRQKKIEIDAGLELARKIDALREQLQTEQGNLRRFREESVAAIQKEIDAYVYQKDILKYELKDLAQKKAVLSIPLDAAWAELERNKRKFLQTELTLLQREDDLTQRQTQKENQEVEVAQEKQRIAEQKRRSVEILSETDSVLDSARAEAIEIQRNATAILSAAEQKNAKANTREESLETREYWIEKDLQRIADLSTDLEKREKVLADRTAMLERNIIRNSKKLP